ncbi:hypothetical protein HYY75_11980, partial [bacterium]|nr:hypothetical protein [bacterium]
NELVEVFSSLDGQERLYLDDIYYGGGTVEKDISSKELAEQVKRRFPDVHYMGDRKSIVQDIVKKAQSGDLVLVMGARDVNQICKKILESLKSD